MYYRQLNQNIKVGLSVPQFSEELFLLIEKNRNYLRTWLSWLDGINRPNDTRDFLELQLRRFSKGEALHETIFYKDKIAGVAGFNCLDKINGIGHIGYWLGKEYTGNGIMTLVVKDLINQGFKYYSLQRVEIRCAVGNAKSRAIPERLDFQNEGTIRRAEKVYEIHNDHVVYGMLKGELRR